MIGERSLLLVVQTSELVLSRLVNIELAKRRRIKDQEVKVGQTIISVLELLLESPREYQKCQCGGCINVIV